ncbi:hypothetical protein [Oceanobacillus luteolus]|uniref:Phospholipase A2 domain-containing protein n=1 Tax=Oceanobacillus luteolus TaxID=1274358 RepID=A0ABW4HTZ6_9BACI
MFGNGRHLTQEEVTKLEIMEKEAVDKIKAHASNFIQEVSNLPTEEQAFIYDMYHPAFKENVRYKGFIGIGTTHYQKYGDDLLVEFNEISIPEKDKTVKTIHGYFNFRVADKVLSQKVEIVKNGDLVVNDTSVAEADSFYIPSGDFPNDPNYTPGEISNDGLITPQWGALCVNACCKFRKYGNPFGTLVTYRHCGSNCGTTGDYGGGTPVNALDRCCASHDACWANFGSWDCDCDRNLVNCARNTSNAGSSRVANFFAAVVAANC